MAENKPKPIPALSQKDIQRFWSKVDKSPGHGPQGECWLWTKATDCDGYGVFTFCNKGIHRMLKVHRISFFLAYGNPPKEKPLVLHSCDFRPCVRPDHLWSGTERDNSHDCKAKGRTLKGSQHPLHVHPEKAAKGAQCGSARLTDDLVRKIRALRKKGMMQKTIAKKIGVGQSTVSRVVLRKNWKHVE